MHCVLLEDVGMTTEFVMIQGRLVEMENRECACGCKKKFRVLPTSTVKYASKMCRQNVAYTPGWRRMQASEWNQKTAVRVVKR